MNRFTMLFGVAASSIALAACSGSDTTEQGSGTITEEVASAPVDTGQQTGDGSSTSPVDDPTRYGQSRLDDPTSLLSQRIVYFGFDSFEVNGADRSVIEAHAQYLAQNPSATLTLEGHADERGTREYNIALGEKRALGVRRLMGALGGTDPQLNTVSFGEERPAIPGHNESSWDKNRRVEIVYLTQ